MIRMIKYFFIVGLIAALVPTAMSNVPASAASEIALFSRASVDTDSLSITGNGDSAKMELKATNDDGKSNRVSSFQLTADNVLSTKVGDKVTVKDNVDFTKAVTTDARNNQKAIGITSNGVINFAGYTQGVYTLDVVVDEDRAYEAIIAIGDQTNQIVDKEITRVNSDYRIEFVFPPIKDSPKCDEGEKLIDGRCEPIGNPYCDLVSDDYKGTCHDRKDCSEDTLLCSCRDGSKVKDWRDCKDAGKHPDEQLKRTTLKPGDWFDPVEPPTPVPEPRSEQAKCEAKGDGFVWENGGCSQYLDCDEQPTHVACYDDVVPPSPEPKPEPDPVIGNCFDGATPVDGKCPNPTGEPACDALGCPGSPPDPGYEPLVPPEAVVPQPVFEEVEDQNIDEIELDEETTGEDEEVEVEEIEEESGESDDEAQDERSEQESESETEEESGGGN